MRYFVALVLLLACSCFPTLFRTHRLLQTMIVLQRDPHFEHNGGSSSSAAVYHDDADNERRPEPLSSQHQPEEEVSRSSFLLQLHDQQQQNDDPSRPFPYFCLTMPERQERVERVLSTIPGLDRQLRYVEGVRGRDLTFGKLEQDGAIRRSTSQRYFLPLTFPLTTNQVAVHLGHLQMLQLFRDEYIDDDVGIFLEDDILPLSSTSVINDTGKQLDQDDDDFVARVRRAVRDAPAGWELLNLARCRAVCDDNDVDDTTTTTAASLLFRYIPRYEQCRTAYAVHRRGLDKLLTMSLPLAQFPGDKHWNALSLSRMVQAYSIAPGLATQSRNETGSYLRVVYDSLHECANDDPPWHRQAVAFVTSWTKRTVSRIAYGTVM
jgi:hypothetical protein